MIPSRPLFLGDIIGNTFVIAAKTWTRAAVAGIIFMLFPVTVMYLTATGFVSTVYNALEKEGYLAPEKLELFRQNLISDLRENNPSLLDLYGIEDVPDSAMSGTSTYDEVATADTELFVD